ncbi:hypothetical protein [Mesorhizobium amorphae]|uniref:hypothetical protein n=1 Tax=Mesorhizobium amorphae TaxID=71433 RepID=UPI0011864E63|nr:hypothetical protein [Mesorhizobium amorphae]
MNRPILFSSLMVRALLDGRKTQTRRVLSNDKFASLFNGTWSDDYVLDPGNQSWRDAEIRFAVGDRLWVREAWRTHRYYDDLAPSEMGGEESIVFEADHPPLEKRPHRLADGRLRQGMHMPRWASRLTLTVTDVRVQRLQEITWQDAKAEGISGGYHQSEFASLWDSLNAARGFGWDTNPWVVAVSFTVERRNIDQVAP